MNRAAIAVASALVVGAPNAYAWRETGHWAVCEIAYSNLSEPARTRLDGLVGEDFPRQCTWPDVVRNLPEWTSTRWWHFVDMPDATDYLSPGVLVRDADNDGLDDGDVIRGILFATDALNSPATSEELKRDWVRFLAHFVGDIHQPLHVGRPGDEGGNKIRVAWYGATQYLYPECVLATPGAAVCTTTVNKTKDVNLHMVWDYHVIDTFVRRLPVVPGDSEFRHKAYAQAVTRPLAPSTRTAITQTTPLDWMNESRLDRSVAYDVLTHENLQDTYAEKASVVINERIFLAGLRLAYLLNRVFDPQSIPPSEELLRREEALRRQIGALNGWAPYERFRPEASNPAPGVLVQPGL
ncbi:S1/P1 Nuclease [Myxococcus fulvus]|uniref:Endonuclease n=1 Tax=Myxococcus fulvus TaxID=33 RepID=A0A511SXA4_MYXFU|nr:S1/P1 nuclease [Myxococcus fulvus]GEN05788.1 endonuclease [Myxococcus fulvus]SES95053.1 S1/P1 Nuclease [Myxococcus fulvus]